MKTLALLILSLGALNVHANEAKEKSWACVGAKFNAAGVITLLTAQGPGQVVILDNGTAAMYALKDKFSLYTPMYNRNNPFNLALVAKYGASTPYTVANNFLSVTWDVVAAPKSTATLKVDLAQGTGTLEMTIVDGDSTSFTNDKLVCTQVGTIGG